MPAPTLLLPLREPIPPVSSDGVMRCPESGYRYREVAPSILRCLDLDEESPLPADLSVGSKSYRQIKEESNTHI